MVQSYKKGRKFKTESPALLSITRGGRPAAAPRPRPSAFRLCAPATIPASVPPSVSALRAPPAHLSVPSSVAALCAVARTPLCAVARTPLCAAARIPLCASASIPTSVLPSASVSRTSALIPASVLLSEIALCAAARTPLCAFASIPTFVLPSASVSRTSAPIPASVPPSAFRLWIVVGVRFLRRGKRGRAVPDKIGVVEILLKNRAPRGWNPANNS